MTDSKNRSLANGLSRREAVYALSQLAAWPGLASAAWYARKQREDVRNRLPSLRNEPLRVPPKFNYPRVVTDSQLANVLARVRLRKSTEPAKVNHIDHALRMWGHEIEFGDKQVWDGAKMLQVLVDDRRLRGHFGKQATSLLVKTRNGVVVRVQEGRETSSHVDHTLATMTEIGLPLSHQIRTRNGPATLREMLVGALRTFSLNQKEFEWTALVFGLYSSDVRGFYTSEGQHITFDILADRIMREAYGQGVCFGGHRLFTLTILLRIDQEQHELFSGRTRKRVLEHLDDATQRLVRSQHEGGFWDDAWPGYPIPQRKKLWDLGAKLVATGHALEWWAMLPAASMLPPRENLVRGSQWLVSQVEQMEEQTIAKNFTFLTHAARALSLWRGQLPADAWRRLRPSEQPIVEASQVTKPNTNAKRKSVGLWNDQAGALLSIELVLLATVAVIGVLVSVVAFRDAIVQELGDSAGSIASLTQSFDYSGVKRSDSYGDGSSLIEVEASVEGSDYVDNRDVCEAVLDATLIAPMCIEFSTDVENEL